MKIEVVSEDRIVGMEIIVNAYGDTDDDEHVIPFGELHLHTTDGHSCICNPEIYKQCSECEETTGGPENCRICGGDGLIETGPDDVPPFVFVHVSLKPIPPAYQA